MNSTIKLATQNYPLIDKNIIRKHNFTFGTGPVNYESTTNAAYVSKSNEKSRYRIFNSSKAEVESFIKDLKATHFKLGFQGNNYTTSKMEGTKLIVRS